MNLLLQIGIIVSLSLICTQDLKQRKVFLWLFILSGILMGYMHFSLVIPLQFVLAVPINCSIVILLVGVLYLYSKITLKKDFKNTFGLGDFLFFLVLAFGFPTATFLVLFSFSIFFAMGCFFLLKNRFTNKTVPLAGLQALFISLVFMTNWIFEFTNLYQI